MIPYEDLVAAIERWRIRNGLPVGEPSAPRAAPTFAAPTQSYAAPAQSYAAPAAAPQPRKAPGPAPQSRPAPQAARPVTEVPLDLGDADVLEEELYTSDPGVDPGPGSQVDYDEDNGEKTSIGGMGTAFDRAQPLKKAPKRGPFDYDQAEDDALDALEAGADVIDDDRPGRR